MVYLATLAQYSLLAVGAAGAVYIYRPDLIKSLLPSTPSIAVENNDPSSLTTKKAKSKKSKSDTTPAPVLGKEAQTTPQDSRTSKKRKIVGPVDDKVIVTAVDGTQKELPRDVDNDLTDKDFARQLAQAQAGTELQSRSQTKTKASALPAASASHAQDSEAHQDDAGWSSVTNKSTSSKDVSDMLEPAGPGPKSLRLTNVEEKKSKPKPKHPEAVKEKKISAKKQQEKEERARIDAEWERKKQQQIQRARMAEGTSKEQKANAFAASQKNAWQNKASGDENSNTAPVQGSLLDTFQPVDQTHSSVQTRPLANVTNGLSNVSNVNAVKSTQGEHATNAMAASEREGTALTEQSSLSEEEQIQRLREQEQDQAWEPVQSKKQKKGKKGTETSSDASPPSSRAISQARPATNGSKTDDTVRSKPQQQQTTNRFANIQVSQSVEDEWAA